MVISTVNQVVYNGDGVTVAWPYTFRIIDNTDIKLAILEEDGSETAITSDYYVDEINNTVYYPGYAPGAEPPAAEQPGPVSAGQRLLIYRELPVTQEKDLGDKWPFEVIELALDKLTMLLQQISGWWDRCLKISPAARSEHPDFDMTFPVEAGKSFRVNTEGTGFEVSDDPGISAAAAIEAATTAAAAAETAAAAAALVDVQAFWFDNVADMRTANLPTGSTAGTKGYYAANDGGCGIYAVRETDGDTDDGGCIIILDNGKVAELITDGTVNVKQYGAKGDGAADDTDAIQKALNSNVKTIVLNQGDVYLISDTIVVNSKDLVGRGRIQASTNFTGTSPAAGLPSNVMLWVLGNHVKIDGAILIGKTSSDRSLIGMYIGYNDIYPEVVSTIGYASSYIVVKNLEFHWLKVGLYLAECWNSCFSEILALFCEKTLKVSGQSVNVSFEQCHFETVDKSSTDNIAIYINSTEYQTGSSLKRPEGLTFTDCFIGNAYDAIYLIRGLQISFTNCVIDLNAHEAFYGEDATSVSFVNCWLSGTTFFELASISTPINNTLVNFVACEFQATNPTYLGVIGANIRGVSLIGCEFPALALSMNATNSFITFSECKIKSGANSMSTIVGTGDYAGEIYNRSTGKYLTDTEHRTNLPLYASNTFETITNLNDITINGCLFYSANTTNAPSTYFGIVFTYRYDANTAYQWAMSAGGMYIRMCASGSWNAWRQLSIV